MYIGWRPASLYGSTIIMNELYTQTEKIRGRWYRYDPDRDVWYPIQATEHPVSAWAWVVIVLLFVAISYYIEYLR